MTSSQRETHITSINNLLLKYGATLDRWGMYHIGIRKFDTRKNNLKIYLNNVKLRSIPMSKVDLEMFEKVLIAYTKDGE